MPLSKDLYTDWIRACGRGDVQALEKMAGGEPWPDLQSQIPKASCLLLTSANGHAKVCEKLLAGRANLEAINDDGETPLIWAAKEGHGKIVDMLIKAGANVLAADAQGRNALIWACQTANASLAKKLLAHTPKYMIDYKDRAGINALISSCYALNPVSMQALLEKGADPNQRYDNSATVLGYAISIKGHELVRLLIEHGARVNRKIDVHGNTNLHLAVLNQDAQMLRVLLDCGANGALANKSGLTARQAAEMQGWKEFETVWSEYEQAKLDASTSEALGKKRVVRL